MKHTVEEVQKISLPQSVKNEGKGAEVHLLASLYDIAWLLNVRGNDISYVPVVLSYLALTQEQCIWFLQEEVVDDTLREYLQKNGITTCPYEAFYEYVKHWRIRRFCLIALWLIQKSVIICRSLHR